MTLIETCIDIARKIYKIVGCGLTEEAYRKAFEHELNIRGIINHERRTVAVEYEGVEITTLDEDILIRHNKETVIIELKAITNLIKGNAIQLEIYMNSEGISDGILIDFVSTSREELFNDNLLYVESIKKRYTGEIDTKISEFENLINLNISSVVFPEILVLHRNGNNPKTVYYEKTGVVLIKDGAIQENIK
jgi:GxxExxY protein